MHFGLCFLPGLEASVTISSRAARLSVKPDWEMVLEPAGKMHRALLAADPKALG